MDNTLKQILQQKTNEIKNLQEENEKLRNKLEAERVRNRSNDELLKIYLECFQDYEDSFKELDKIAGIIKNFPKQISKDISSMPFKLTDSSTTKDEIAKESFQDQLDSTQISRKRGPKTEVKRSSKRKLK